MKKLLFVAAFLGISASIYAEKKEQDPTLCTIVCSPCPQVPNTLIEGNASADEIEAAQRRMLEECSK